MRVKLQNILCLLLSLLVSINIVNCMNVCVPSTQFKDANFKKLVDSIDLALKTHPSGVAQYSKACRLAFHDCVSGCNGCIELTNADNAGLETISNMANRTWKDFSRVTFYGKFLISRADVYMLYGQRAIYNSSNYEGLTLPVSDFKFGRKTCTSSQDNKEIFANAHGNWQSINQFYKDEFDFSVKDIVALMGSHSLGRAWKQFSGYDGPWVVKDNQVFNNIYYQNMLDAQGLLEYKSHVNLQGKVQWHSAKDSCDGYDRRNCRPKPGPEQRIMLNADMCLLKIFNIDTIGTPDCTYSTCKTNEEGKSYVELYANSEPEFKKAFSEVYQKMIEHGADGLIDPENTSDTRIPSPVSYANYPIISKILKSTENETMKTRFKIYHLIFKKKYEINTREGINRYIIFKRNVNIIKQQNSKFSLGLEKYVINPYTDYTTDEYFRFITATVDKETIVDSQSIADFKLTPYSQFELDA